MAILQWKTDPNFTIKSLESHWKNVLSGKEKRQNTNCKIVLICLTALAIAATIATIAAIGYCATTSTTSQIKTISGVVNYSSSNAFFIVPTALLGIVVTALLGIVVIGMLIASIFTCNSNMKKLESKFSREEISEGELKLLFGEGKLVDLQEYVGRKGVDALVYQRIISVQEGVELITFAVNKTSQDPKYITLYQEKISNEQEKDWDRLKNQIHSNLDERLSQQQNDLLNIISTDKGYVRV
jgi:hypothetical protein